MEPGNWKIVTMHLQIITPEKTVLDSEEVNEILVPTEKGQIGVLPHHINLITSLASGEVHIKTKDKMKILGITGGFLEIKNGNATILADYAEHAENIDAEKALEAKKKAEEILKTKKDILPQEDLIKAQAELRRSLLQLHIAQNHQNRHRKSS